MSADSALRANVRLLGDLLGRVLVEQEGQELLDAEERIRALARDARAGGSRGALRKEVSGSASGGRPRFSGPSPSSSSSPTSPSSITGSAAAASTSSRVACPTNRSPTHSTSSGRRHRDEDQREAAGRTRVELVLTAHPTEATRRTVLEAHRRIAAPRPARRRSAPRRNAGAEDRLAEEVTLLWQTDEVRSKRPKVVDEIRQGLWFFEQSFWNAVPDLERELAEHLGEAPARFVSGPGSAATSTAIRTSGRTRSRMRSSGRARWHARCTATSCVGWARRGGCRRP